jgi:ACT domain-containing protein
MSIYGANDLSTIYEYNGAYINIGMNEENEFNVNVNYNGNKRSFEISSVQINYPIMNTQIDDVIEELKQIERIKKIKKLTK